MLEREVCSCDLGEVLLVEEDTIVCLLVPIDGDVNTLEGDGRHGDDALTVCSVIEHKETSAMGGGSKVERGVVGVDLDGTPDEWKGVPYGLVDVDEREDTASRQVNVRHERLFTAAVPVPCRQARTRHGSGWTEVGS